MDYKYKPTTKDELIDAISKEIESQGWEADLNCIDTSLIADMEGLFDHSKFDGDISKWNVGNVTNMGSMFEHSKFNGDISEWDVSGNCDTEDMYEKAVIKPHFKHGYVDMGVDIDANDLY